MKHQIREQLRTLKKGLNSKSNFIFASLQNIFVSLNFFVNFLEIFCADTSRIIEGLRPQYSAHFPQIFEKLSSAGFCLNYLLVKLERRKNEILTSMESSYFSQHFFYGNELSITF